MQQRNPRHASHACPRRSVQRFGSIAASRRHAGFLGQRGAADYRPSALALARSIWPVGFRLWADWNALSAADDFEPHFPSTSSVAPFAFSAICTLATFCWAGVRLAGIAGGGGGAGAAT